MLSPGVGEAWEGTVARTRRPTEGARYRLDHFPTSSRFWPHNMRELYSQVFGVEAPAGHPSRPKAGLPGTPDGRG